MQELVALAVIIGSIVFSVVVVFVNVHLGNRSEIQFLSHNGTVAAVSCRRCGAAGETAEIDFANLGARAAVVGLSLRGQFWPAWFGAQRSIGTPHKGLEIELRSDGKVSPENPGRMYVRGPCACLATMGRDSGEVHVLAEHDGGWYDTGDLAVPDGQGRTTVVGRAADGIGGST